MTDETDRWLLSPAPGMTKTVSLGLPPSKVVDDVLVTREDELEGECVVFRAESDMGNHRVASTHRWSLGAVHHRRSNDELFADIAKQHIAARARIPASEYPQ